MKTHHQRQAEAASDSFVQNATHDLNGPKTTRFLDPLPTEIAIKVASHLDQRDCLACMAVCRSWYLTAPQYMQNVWKEVRILFKRLPKNNARWERCVRDYSKSIVLPDYAYSKQYAIMQKLVDCQCSQISSLELSVPNNVSAERRKVLQSLIKQLAGDSLTQLIFNDLFNKMNIFDALCTYPNLVKFSLQASPISRRFEVQRQPILPQFIRLTHLKLECQVSIKLQLKPILKNSPNLQYLAYGQHNISPLTTMNQDPLSANDFDDVFSSCPKLTRLEVNVSPLTSGYRSMSWNLIQQNQTNGPGLQSLILCEQDEHVTDQVEPYLLRNAATLEFIAIEYIKGWSSLMSRLQFPRLRMLVLHVSTSLSAPWKAVVPECPILEHLELKGVKDGQFGLSALQGMKQLKRLSLSNFTLSYHQYSFKHLVMHGCAINHITLGQVYSVSDIFLESITQLPTLEHLSITFPRNDDDGCTSDGLIRFATQLGNTSIRTLSLHGSRYLPGSFLQAVGGLSTLYSFYFHTIRFRSTRTPEVDTSDILKLLEISGSLKNIDILGVVITGTAGEQPHTSLKKKVQGYKVNVGEVSLPGDITWASFKRC
ncbi:hypothetical protein BJV82DRAFT_585149 [Fennellomyces sp. T-0311]|nr:hypothetical protein BJV82DRAFT_585149 [Fennellomyces sp. T-0311]